MPTSKSHFHSSNLHLQELKIIATELRQDVIKMLLSAGSGHSAGPLGLADVFACLYFNLMNIDPQNPTKPDRDKLILSNGHVCPIWYATLCKRGYFDENLLKTLRKFKSPLQGHPHINSLPGVENTSGPLGQGLGVAIGIALANNLNNLSAKVFCITSDAELQEGAIWEAAMYAGNKHLHNLTWLIDRNNIQIDGYTEEIMPLEPLREKLESFNWHVIEINGNNIEEIISAVEFSKTIFERSTAIIAHTIPGKGVAEMESRYEWHGKPPSVELANEALRNLRSLEGQIETEYD